MKDDLLPHIRHAYSTAEAQRYADFADEKKCLDEVVSIGKEVLGHVPPCAGACAIMSGRAMEARVQYRPTPQRLRRLSPGP